MKKSLSLLLFLVFALAIWAQGLETFDNFDYTGTNYIDGSFVGEDGIEWTYYHVTGSTAGNTSNPIEGNGMILRRSEVPSRIESAPIPGGISNFNVQMRKAYTSGGVRQLALYINDNLIAESETFGGDSGADATVHNFTVNGINIPGDIVIKIVNIQGGGQNRQVTIDNISWEAYGSGMQFVDNPTFNPPAGYYSQPISVEISTNTEGASIYYTLDGSEPNQNSTLYSTPISITTATTIKARGYADGYEPSAVVNADYRFVVPVSNMAELRSMEADNLTAYQITGDVYLAYKRSSRNQKYVQDATGGVLIDDQTGVITTNYEIGDAITGLTGKLSLYFETLQFLPLADPGPATSSGNSLPVPVLTVADLNSDIGFNTYQSRLVRLNDISFDNPAGNYEAAQNYPIHDATGAMTLRTAFAEVDYIGTPLSTESFSVLGIVAHYQNTVQITPRWLADFNPLSTEDEVQSPQPVALIGNYPNPFNPSTTIQYYLEKPADAELNIYNQKGQLVQSFEVKNAKAGINEIVWNGIDNKGRAASSGVYFFRLKSGSYSSTKKMVLMK